MNKLKKIWFPLIAIFLVFIFTYMIVYFQMQKKIKSELNTQIEIAMEIIKEKYPEAKDEDIIDLLKTPQGSISEKETDNPIMTKYGFEQNEIYNKILKEYNEQNLILFIVTIIAMFFTLAIFINFYNKKQNKKIKEINKYIDDISNNKNYELKIKENTEDELSKLENELYKITILLKESADSSNTKSKNLEKSLEDISHQIKAPITSITIMLDNIEDNPDMDEKTKNDFIKSISQQIELISNLVVTLLNVAKFDSGTIKLINKEFEIGDLLNDVKNKLGVIADVKQVEIEVNGDITAKVTADYRWQNEAITNIVKNAIEHSRPNSKVIISVEKTNVFLQIKIQDFGEGISKNDIKHIFERFYKTNNSSRDSIGIGLNFAKTIIEKSGGIITVDSIENKGTTFTIKYLQSNE